MNAEENERQYRIVDQMLSMHATLRERYARRARLLSVCLIAASILLCAFVFASDNVLTILGLQPDAARVGLGLVSVAVLILSIIELRVDWKGVADRHTHAASILAGLKAEYRKVYSEAKGSNEETNARLGHEFEQHMKA